MNVTSSIRDGFANVLARLGQVRGAKDAGNSYYLTALSFEEIEAAYRTSWFRKIVDIPPFDMTRQWRAWQADDQQIGAIEKIERKLRIASKVRRAMTWGRLYGGAGLILGIKGQASQTPLDPLTITKDSLLYVHVVSIRNGLTAGEIDNDPLSETFGEPSVYRLTGGGASGAPVSVDIHPTRVVRFIGNELPAVLGSGAVLGTIGGVNPSGWGDSLWHVMQEAVKHSDSTHAGIAAMILEAKVDVYKIPGLMGKISTPAYETSLVSRFNLGNQLKSINNALLTDAEEEWQQKTQTFTGLPEVAALFLSVMAGLADIPATRLLGKSPDGMNATGDSDTRNYYDMLKSRQELEVRPSIETLDEVLIRSALGSRPDEIGYEWNPLYQMTPAEKATRDSATADVVTKYNATGLVPDSVMAAGVKNQLIEDRVFPGVDQAYADAEDAGEEPPALTEPSPAEIAMAKVNAPANNNEPFGQPSKRAVGDSTPRSLYIRRQVLNAGDIIEWAKGQGFEQTVPADQMHVTIAFSRQPVDWVKVGVDWSQDDKGRVTIAPGGPRAVEPLGPHQAPVLMFAGGDLMWRWRSIKDAGASWEYGDDFQPHITISYAAATLPLTKVVPYRGQIVLGPEIFEEVNDDWKSTFEEEPT